MRMTAPHARLHTSSQCVRKASTAFATHSTVIILINSSNSQYDQDVVSMSDGRLHTAG